MGYIPLYERIKQRIRSDILEANGSGVRLPTERELEARYRVSRPTISKALTALAAEGLLIKAQGRGNFTVARSIGDLHAASDPPRRIGFVAPISGEELVQRMFRGIDRAAHRRDYRVLMGSAGNHVGRERAAAHELIASGSRGLIVYPVPRTDEEQPGDYLRAETLEVPVVLVDTCTAEQGHTQVVFDNRRAGYAMTSWLLHHGHRRIALLLYPHRLHHSSLDARLCGYRDALREHGLALDPLLLRRFDQLRPSEAMAVLVDEWLDLPEPPTAIIAPEDIAALDLIELLQLRGLRVPDEMQVVGFDNREAARRFRPTFPTTSPDFEHMGELACEVLLDAVEARAAVPRTFVLDAPLLVRRPSRLPDVHAPGLEALDRRVSVGLHPTAEPGMWQRAG